ncbi:hypothetical protein [Corynebacterium gottingense]|uniref:hypothetical protein n=1 Tax=Corynebacterium gottingense TaxID=2041036 RepID=UPI0011C43984|nr:hypothetical protein [Corynebacterium gottingense]WJZ14240.1 hypothetical protein CGOTT_11745 [Corynebacterium gottingense]WJZ16553.1 hypothetical protein CGOTTB_11685 [Corynebacterium gottingense]
MPRKYDLSKAADRRRWARDVQKSLQKDWDRAARQNPLKIPIATEAYEPTASTPQESQSSFPLGIVQNNTYNGPVVHGDGAQVQFHSGNDGRLHQNQNHEVTPGYETLANTLQWILETVPSLNLSTSDAETVVNESQLVLAEATKSSPDRSRISRALDLIKGILSPFALGLEDAVSDSTKELAGEAIKSLTQAASGLP